MRFSRLRCGLLLCTVIFCLRAGPIPPQVVDPEAAVEGKAFSPNGVYGFWLAEYLDPSSCYYSGCWVSPVMSGPRGLLNPGLEFWGGGHNFRALVSNSGKAVLSWTVSVDDWLAWFDYEDESAHQLENHVYYFPGLDPSHPHPFIDIESSIYPLSITDTAITARIAGFVGNETMPRDNLLARWDLSGGAPVIIPEPAPYVLIAAGIGMVALLRRIRAR